MVFNNRFFWLGCVFWLVSSVVSAANFPYQGSDDKATQYSEYQLAVSSIDQRGRLQRGRLQRKNTSDKIVIRKRGSARSQRKLVTRKAPSFSHVPVAELKKNAVKCTLMPNSWAFVTTTKNTLPDYQRALSRLSGDAIQRVTERLQAANKNSHLNAFKFFSYVHIPAEYKSIFQKKYKKKITNNNTTKGCAAAARPSRVVVAPSNMTIQTLVYALGARQKESFSILEHQLAKLNSNVRPGVVIKKGDIVLIPQSYPYSSAVVASASKQTASKKVVVKKKSTETLPQDRRTEKRGGFLWSFSYGQSSDTLVGEDTIGGGNFELVSEAGSAWKAVLGYDLDSTKGQLTFFLGYNKSTVRYKKVSNVDILGTDVKKGFPLLRWYYQPSFSSLGLAIDIGQKHLADIERSNSELATIIGEDVVYVAGALHYQPSITLWGVHFDMFASVNTPLGVNDIEGRFAIDFGGLAIVHATENYDISLDMNVSNTAYKETEKNLTSSSVYIGVSVYGI